MKRFTANCLTIPYRLRQPQLKLFLIMPIFILILSLGIIMSIPGFSQAQSNDLSTKNTSSVDRLASEGENNKYQICLFFDCRTKLVEKSKKKVFAHYFTAFPISIDNKEPEFDYYTQHYLSPNGENGKFSYSGGFIKQRPMPRAVINSANWTELDLKSEVETAQAIGLDGFIVDILSSEGMHWNRTKQLMDVAKQVSNDFKILLMPDMEGQFKLQPEKLKFVIRSLSMHPAAFRLEDGRVVIAPYNAQNQTAAWWKSIIDQMKLEGIEIALFPVFQGWEKYSKDFSKISYGISDWGVRSPDANRPWRKIPKQAAELGVKWMMPVSPQDVRPKSLLYWEAKNSLNYRTMWDNAIVGNADWVQVITWNDYSESSEISPSTGTGRAFTDLTAYYINWFKTGLEPVILKDAIYYFHRLNSVNAKANLQKQPRSYSLFPGSDPPLDEIEVLSFLTRPATLDIIVGASKVTTKLNAGMSSTRIPLAEGQLELSLRRGNSLVIRAKSNFLIKSDIEYQDFLYRGGGKIAEHPSNY